MIKGSKRVKPVQTECVRLINKWLTEESPVLMPLLTEYLWRRGFRGIYPVTGYRYKEPFTYIIPRPSSPMHAHVPSMIYVKYGVDKEMGVEARSFKKFIKQEYYGNTK